MNDEVGKDSKRKRIVVVKSRNYCRVSVISKSEDEKKRNGKRKGMAFWAWSVNLILMEPSYLLQVNLPF